MKGKVCRERSGVCTLPLSDFDFHCVSVCGSRSQWERAMEVVRPQLIHRWISVFVLICLFSFEAQCFYLPGVAPQDFMKVSFSSCSVGFVVIRWLCWDIGGLRLNDEENMSSMLFFVLLVLFMCVLCAICCICMIMWRYWRFEIENWRKNELPYWSRC